MSIETNPAIKPIALFLICDPETDPVDAFSDRKLKAEFETVSKTHEMVFLRIKDNQLGLYFKQAKENFPGRLINSIFLCGHGAKNSIQFGTDRLLGLYTVDDVHAETFKDLEPGTHIYCIACWAGCELAEQMSKVSNLAVTGYLNPGISGASLLIPRKDFINPSENRWAMVRIVISDHKSVDYHLEADVEYSKGIRRNLSFDGLDMVRQMARDKNPQARALLAISRDNKSGPLDLESLLWFYESAMNGDTLCREELLKVTAKDFIPTTERQRQIFTYAPALDHNTRIRWLSEMGTGASPGLLIGVGDNFANEFEPGFAALFYLKAKLKKIPEAKEKLDYLIEKHLGFSLDSALYSPEDLVRVMNCYGQVLHRNDFQSVEKIADFLNTCQALSPTERHKKVVEWYEKALKMGYPEAAKSVAKLKTNPSS